MSVEITELVNGVIGKADGSGLRFDVSDSGTTTVLRGITVRRDTSGTPAAGIGTGIEFEVETASTPNREIGAAIDCVSTDVTATSEDFDLVFRGMSGGALNDVLKIKPTFGNYGRGDVQFIGAVTTYTVAPQPNSLRFLNGAASAWAPISASNYGVDPTGQVRWGNSNPEQTFDAGLARNAAGVIRATNGSTGIGSILSTKLVEANTAGSGAPNVITATESRTVFTNEGATAANYHTLPTAVAGYEYTFVVQDADGIRVVANTGDTIRVIDKVTASAGYVESTTIGSVVTLVSINATEWIATRILGTWTDGTFTYDDTSLTTP